MSCGLVCHQDNGVIAHNQLIQVIWQQVHQLWTFYLSIFPSCSQEELLKHIQPQLCAWKKMLSSSITFCCINFLFLHVCVCKARKNALWVHTYVTSWGLWSVNEQRMSHPVLLHCLALLHKLIFLIRLLHTWDFLVASLCVGSSTVLDISLAAFIFNPATTQHSLLHCLVSQVICLMSVHSDRL